MNQPKDGFPGLSEALDSFLADLENSGKFPLPRLGPTVA